MENVHGAEARTANGNAADQGEVISLEEYAREGKAVPEKALRFKVRIDKTIYVVDKPVLTGTELLKIAGKTPETHNLYMIIRGNQPTPVAPDAAVDLRTPGLERFTTVPRDPTEGLAGGGVPTLRRDFALAGTDRLFLDGLSLAWETVKEGGSLWLLLRNWVLPMGYNVPTASLALRIPAGYPDTQIDMAYFCPPLSRADGHPINNLTPLTIEGRTYQQWSRHRTGTNPWRPNEDDIASHLALVDAWLRREFRGA